MIPGACRSSGRGLRTVGVRDQGAVDVVSPIPRHSGAYGLTKISVTSLPSVSIIAPVERSSPTELTG